MIPAVGEKIGPYEILGRLGSGGMGLVYSAWDSRLQRDVAIKLLREEYAAGFMRDRFLQEARAASGLNHPNICTVFDLGEQDGDPYMVMELLKGETLRSRILAGPLSPQEILHIGIEIADALAAAHARGIIHRDIKPANIFLVAKPGQRWQAKVLDFGLAKIDLGDGLDAKYNITGTGSTVGTVAYMSPEQARGETLDVRSDLFALGIVLYEMATGRVPFEGATSALVFVQLLSHPPEPVRETNPAIPKDFERIIFKLLSKDRNARYQTAADLLDALHHIVLKKTPAGKSALLTLPAWLRGPAAGAAPAKPLPPPSAVTSPSIHIPPSSPTVLKPADRTPLPPSPPPAPLPDKARLTDFAEPARSPEPTRSPVPVGPATAQPPVATPAPVADARIAGRPSDDSVIRPVRRVVTDVLNPPAEQGPRPTPQRRVNDATPAGPSRIIESDPRAARSRERNSLFNGPISGERSASRSGIQAQPANFSYSVETESEEVIYDEPKAWHEHPWVWATTAVIFALAAFGAYRWHAGDGSPALTSAPTLMMATFENHTGDSTLDGVVMEGLRLSLAQSPRTYVPDPTQVASGMRSAGLQGSVPASPADAQAIAASSGSTHFLFGEIRGGGGESSPYVISARLYDSRTGARIPIAEEPASSREQIGDAIDRVSAEVRTALGEQVDASGKTNIPLAQEATSNIDALGAYVVGSQKETTALGDSIRAYQRAVQAEPHFTQAWLRLAELYRRQGAELAAADAATRARDGSERTSERTRLMALATYEMNATADYPHALALLHEAAKDYPRDLSITTMETLVLRLEGKFSEALELSQSVLAGDSSNFEASGQAELSLLALERVAAAAQLEAESRRAGMLHPGSSMLVTFLNDKPGSPLSALPATTPSGLRAQAFRAQLLDASGHQRDGFDAWRNAATDARAVPALGSAAAYALAQGALDHAIIFRCAEANDLLRDASTLPMGQAATFSAGMARGLCGDAAAARKAAADLLTKYPVSFPVKNWYVAELNAVQHLRSGDSQHALDMLQSSKQFDLVSVSGYLRGLAHGAAGQWSPAIADFQQILLHRGAATLACAPMYPMAQLGLARAYAASGDYGNSAAAYRQFLTMWAASPANDPLRLEAEERSR